MANLNMAADPAKARKVIEFMQRPENAGMNNCQVARALGINEAYVRRAKVVFRWGMTMKLNPKKLRRDGGTQSREAIDDAVVAEYVEAWQAGGAFPPVDAFYDGTDYWLADGFHRVIAAIQAGIKSIEVQSHPGTARDAILFSVGANTQHGIRRKPEDKRRAVLTLLNDEEWSQWTDNQVATRCGVSRMFVGMVRKDSHCKAFTVTERKTIDKHGNVSTIDTSKIGKRPKTQPEPNQGITGFDPEPSPEESAKVPSVESNGVHEKNGSEIAQIPATPGPVKVPEPAPIPTTQARAPEPAKVAALASPPASTVDAPKPVDPPDIAAQKAKGIIPKDAVVTVTEPDPADEDEPADVQREQTDLEWLAECPARENLSPTCRNGFDVAALNYRRTDEERARYQRAMRQLLRHPPGFPDYLTSWFNRCCGLKHPKHWVVCKDCDGSGQVPMIGKCPLCHGRGFHG